MPKLTNKTLALGKNELLIIGVDNENNIVCLDANNAERIDIKCKIFNICNDNDISPSLQINGQTLDNSGDSLDNRISKLEEQVNILQKRLDCLLGTD